MPDINFLEKYPLYRNFEFNFPNFISDFPEVNINMYCKSCKAIRTFTLKNYYKDIIEGDIGNHLTYTMKKFKRPLFVALIYLCASCDNQYRLFFIKLKEDFKHIEKIGQEPPWDISLEKGLEEILGDFASYYKNGKICESQAYGIGAFAYYRRMIEGTLDHLLDLITELIPEGESEAYQEALKKTKDTTVASEKIELIYDLLPPILSPRELNPMKTLYDKLSIGLHGRSDEECLEDAAIIRETTLFLVETILRTKKAKMEFTEKMKKLLKKK